jgi:hypothetical protein
MDDTTLTLDEALAYALTVLRGMHAEVRAARLEARAMLGKQLTEEDAAALTASLAVADEVAAVLEEDDAPEPVRGMA